MLKVLVAYGPTREPLDPVRFLSNHSTGVMGRALVSASKARGFETVSVECPNDAETARDLLKILTPKAAKCDLFIMAAAVCDVRPKSLSSMKIKKDKLMTLEMVKNPDVLGTLAQKKKPGQIFVGFALESESLIGNARKKLSNKNLDWIVAQKVSKTKSPFGETRLDAMILKNSGPATYFKGVSKAELAVKLLEIVASTKPVTRRGSFARL